NLMPCVLPVISLKIFGFVQHAGQSRQKILRSGIAFAGGIFAWFIGLAALLIALKAAGREITWWGLQFTNAYFVLFLSVIVLVFAAGMSAPYLLLCARPAWLRFLPKPGPWMLHVKQFMGFLLLATLLFLLYVLGAQRGLEGAIWASCFLLFVSIACWMKGAFVVPSASVATRQISIVLLLALV